MLLIVCADRASAGDRIGEIVSQEIAAGHIPGAVILLEQHGRIVYRGAFGSMSLVPAATAMQPDAIFDLASLTKVLATTTAIMQLAETGRLRLDAAVAEIGRCSPPPGRVRLLFVSC